jgi:hypothetical protein
MDVTGSEMTWYKMQLVPTFGLQRICTLKLSNILSAASKKSCRRLDAAIKHKKLILGFKRLKSSQTKFFDPES